jgi:lysophospholipase L1-like esterase
MLLRPLLILLAAAIVAAGCPAGEGAGVIRDDDRVVFVGDSITGQGTLAGAGGWTHLIGEGLLLARPEAKPMLIGLGGSGSTVGHWLHVEKLSRSEPVHLDVKETDVGKTLDGHVDIVVVMLGMNDVLSPSMAGAPSDLDAWAARYAELIEALRARCHPRVVGLATVTPCTEDPASPKNVALAEMNRRLATLASAKGCRLLPTAQSAFDILALGRAHQPVFHVTGDFVHPNAAGHLAIAAGMLRGLGEEAAAARLLEKHMALYQPAPGQPYSLTSSLTRIGGSPDDEAQRFTVAYRWSSTRAAPVTVSPALPPGWTAEPTAQQADEGRFTISGPLDRAENTIGLTATSGGETSVKSISIPPGWRIATGRGRAQGWVQNSTYDPAKDRQPVDAPLMNGEGLTTPVPFPAGESGPWTLLIASNDYTGLNRVGSVDLAAVTFFSYGHQAYGARWIRSDRERPVRVRLGSQVFAGTWSLGVALNGTTVYEGRLASAPGGTVAAPALLKQGWNLLVFKSTFIAWQWQFSIDLAGEAGDDLGDLRYATRPPPER